MKVLQRPERIYSKLFGRGCRDILNPPLKKAITLESWPLGHGALDQSYFTTCPSLEHVACLSTEFKSIVPPDGQVGSFRMYLSIPKMSAEVGTFVPFFANSNAQVALAPLICLRLVMQAACLSHSNADQKNGANTAVNRHTIPTTADASRIFKELLLIRSVS